MSLPTDVTSPHHYHKVVDCQWACPAHTNVPEYLRLIAQGRYTESYLLNRESNVFPGILGRTCDRPCEPACRRVRVDGKPVAICRLKRVAADLRDDITAYLPKAPDVRNGKRVALIGAGPASLTVANDLLPIGYDVVIYEKNARAGGLMRFNIPAFRLPEHVLNEETQCIIDMGADVRYNTSVESLKALLSEGYDAIFVGSGAPKGKELDVPGRWDPGATGKIHIGIEWLGSVHFGHIDKIGQRVLIIGVGNTAMDCCRTSRRLGGTDTKVVARRSRPYFKASPWELEDAEEEGIHIVENHAPKRFVIEELKVLRDLNVVSACPSPLAKDLVEPVGVCTLVGIRYQLAALHRAISALLARRRRHAPLDFRRIERIEQLNSDLLDARRREAIVRDHAVHAGHRRDRRRRIVLRTCCSIHVHLLFSFI